MPRTPIAATTSDWKRLADSVTPEIREGVQHLERAHAKLLRFITEIRELVRERDLYEARKQEATRKIQERLVKGRKAATALRIRLKYHLGDDNEELARFGINPVRAGKRRKTSRKTSKAEGSTPAGEGPT
jgi:hypothetical protein